MILIYKKAYNNRGSVLRELGRLNEAIENYVNQNWDKAIELLGKDRVYIICSNSIEKYKDHFKGDNFIFIKITNYFFF